MDALLVIDVQRGLFADPNALPHEGEALIQRIAGLIAAARAAGKPVIFIQHDGGAGDVLEAGTPGFSFVAALTPGAEDPVFVKRFCSAFQNTGLADHLTARNLKNLVLCGMATEYCIDTSCRAAFERGFGVTLAADAHTTFDSANLPARDIVAHHNTTLVNAGFVTLRRAAELTFP